MTSHRVSRIARGIGFLLTLGGTTPLHAQADLGTWVRQTTATTPGAITLTISACCNGGRRYAFSFTIGPNTQVMTVDSPLDGSDVPALIDGKPSGETMAVRRLDDHHTHTVVKLNGKPFGTSDGTLSADGKTITVLNEYMASVGGQPAGKTTETWVRK